MQHLFVDCLLSRSVFSAFGDYYGIPSIPHNTVRSFLEQWFICILVSSVYIYFPLFFFWCIWKHRNRCIFDNKLASVYVLLKQIDDLLHLYPVPKKKIKTRVIGSGPLIGYPCGFFDGAAAGNIGGASFVIHLSASYFLSFSLGCGRSTNTRSELLALWALLSATNHLGIPLFTIFGDSPVIISWVNRNASLNAPLLSHCYDEILSLLQHVPSVTIKHIYHEHNQ